MKKTWLAVFSVFALALLLAACGGNDNDADTGADGGGTTTEQTDDGAAETDEGAGEGGADAGYDAEAAEASYQQTCSSCHGGNLEGANGPALDNIGARLSQDEILDAIVNGRAGMPPGLLQGDEAENVAAWLADMK